jgi:hypothetical protein
MNKIKLIGKTKYWFSGLPKRWNFLKIKHVVNEKKKEAHNYNKYLGLENIEPETGKILNYEKSENITGKAYSFPHFSRQV